MISENKFHRSSHVSSNEGSTSLSFSPNLLREPTFFVAELQSHVNFREAISCLHNVVVSDLRFKPRERSDYKAWLKEKENSFLAEHEATLSDKKEQLALLERELSDINKKEKELLAPYNKAQEKYFNYLYEYDYDAWFVLDPVITIHPDQIFFECFSQDESSYAKLSCDYEVFKNIHEQSFGTTNIDYSHELFNEFQKVRSYKKSMFSIDPTGFEISTENSDTYKEEKIDLPDSWVRGFLQVSSAMSMPMLSFDLHPQDIANILFVLKRNKERESPRSLRFILKEDKPIHIVVEPFNITIKASRSISKIKGEHTVRIWGRRRLFILERLISITHNFKVHLLGTGLPSFFVAQMQGMSFTLALSGWSSSDFSKAGNFDLLAPRAEVDEVSAKQIYDALKEVWVDSSLNLSKRLHVEEVIVKSALNIYAQHGEVLYDLDTNMYRIRQLSDNTSGIKSLHFSSELQDKANNFVLAKCVKILSINSTSLATNIKAKVMDNAKYYTASISIDSDMRLVQAHCQCHQFIQKKKKKGACEHIIATRLQANEEHLI